MRKVRFTEVKVAAVKAPASRWRGVIGQRRCHDGCRRLVAFGWCLRRTASGCHLMGVLPCQAAVDPASSPPNPQLERGAYE